jgi:hypothetical protein
LLIFSLVLLAAVLGFAVLRPQGWTEALIAVPAAAILIGAGAIPMHDNDADDGIVRFTRLGLCTVPVTLVVAVTALWAGVRLIGAS